MQFEGFTKIPRLSRQCTVTEKIDGTNACVVIMEDGQFLTGSRERWITPDPVNDNYGFSAWAHENKEELMKLGPGKHYGEWWGDKIQRNYGLSKRKFSLFNTHKWSIDRPKCCDVVPILYEGIFDTFLIGGILNTMRTQGSLAAPGFMKPEGIIIYHEAAKQYFKKTLEKDEEPKGIK